MERALITGVAGFIGSHLAAELLRQGWTVTGVDQRSPGNDPTAAANLADLEGQERFHLVIADLNRSDLPMLVEDTQVVFHLAALAGVRRSWGERFADYLTGNVLATQRLLEACNLVEVPRLVLASSSSVYGPNGGCPSREGDLPAPASPYGATKLAAERLALAYASRPGAITSVIALRYQITPTATGEAAILHAAAQAHLAYFGKEQLLVKSPFNCFRIPQIEQQWVTPSGTYTSSATSVRRRTQCAAITSSSCSTDGFSTPKKPGRCSSMPFAIMRRKLAQGLSGTRCC